MSLPIAFRPEARAEFDAAADWYEQRRIGLGLEFIDTVDQPLARVAHMPEMYAMVHRDIRRAVLRRFPYSILYRVEPNQVVIVSVFHSGRDPMRWKSRS